MELKLDPVILTVIGALISAITALALYIRSMHKHQSKREQENADSFRKDSIMITQALIGNSTALNNVSLITNEVKTLINTMYIEQIKTQKHGSTTH